MLLPDGTEYLTPEEIELLYGENAEGVDIQEQLDMYGPIETSETDGYVIIENGIPKTICLRPNWYGSDGNPVSDHVLHENGMYNYIDCLPPNYDRYNEIVYEAAIEEYQVDYQKCTVTKVWKKRDLKDYEKENYLKQRWEEIRASRDEMLKESDWTQTVDQPEEFRKKWAEYRQGLRDVTEKFDDPRKVIFPRRPL